MKKRTGKRLFEISDCQNKTIESMEFIFGSLVISFTNASFIELCGGNDGEGGYIAVRLPSKEHQKRDKMLLDGFHCKKCGHRWLPRSSEPANCPNCGSGGIISMIAKQAENYPVE